MPTGLKETIENLVREKAPGPTPSFSLPDLLRALELIADKAIGRNKLAQELGVGEGTVRTLIGRLRNTDLIKASKAGCSLTKKGLKIWKEYTATFKKTMMEKNELTFGEYNVAILVRKSASHVSTGMGQRDAAVMAGARGATTVLFKKGHLVFPSSDNDVARDSPQASSQMLKLLKPEGGDAIIVVSADNSRKAEAGAIAAAWTLLKDNHNT
jgi:predicted transcriptional regulator